MAVVGTVVTVLTVVTVSAVAVVDDSVVNVEQRNENIYYTLPVLLCWFELYSRLRLYSRLLTASHPLFAAS